MVFVVTVFFGGSLALPQSCCKGGRVTGRAGRGWTQVSDHFRLAFHPQVQSVGSKSTMGLDEGMGRDMRGRDAGLEVKE